MLSLTAAPRFTTPSLPALAKLIRYGEITGIASTQMPDFDCLNVIIICFVFHPRRTWRVAVQLALEKNAHLRTTNVTPPLVQVSMSPAKHSSYQKASANSLEFQTAVFLYVTSRLSGFGRSRNTGSRNSRLLAPLSILRDKHSTLTLQPSVDSYRTEILFLFRLKSEVTQLRDGSKYVRCCK